MQLILGLLLGALIAVLAYGAKALTANGAWAAALTGGLIFGLGGFSWAALLLAFFISSSLLSRAFAARKAAFDEKFSKGSRRDYGQVLANGGLGAALALAYAFLPGQDWQWHAFAGAMAAVNADTWATELGVLSPYPPRLITNGKVVEGGTSGGITLLGYLAALSGAVLIGLGAAISPQSGSPSIFLIGIIAMAGLAGSTVDSLLGATIQSIYYCPACKKETERWPMHACGAPTRPLRGWHWLNNDVVNFACSGVGATTAAVAGQLFL